jgi:hypothetical protein
MARKSKTRGISPLDLAMAAFAAGSVGFVVYVMPNASFERVVELSGLPLVLPGANPPLGMTARLAALAFTAIGTFVLVALVLRSLGKGAKRPQPKLQPKLQGRSEPEEIDIPLPKIRRADAHPDAPARRPIFAGLDLGAPFDAATFEQQHPVEQDLAGRQDEEFVLGEEDLHYPPLEAEEETTPFPEDELHYPVVEEEEVEEEAEASEAVEAAEGAEATEERPLPSFIAPQEEEAGSDEPEAGEPDTSSTAPEAPEADENGQDSISHLMQRLELGLVRREGSGSGPVMPFAQSPVGETPNQMDHRLRSAIDDLQKLAARGR